MKEDLKELISKYQEGKCTDAEIARLESWYLQWNETDRVSLTKEQLEQALQRSRLKLYSPDGSNSKRIFTVKMLAAVTTAAILLLTVLTVIYNVGYFRKTSAKLALHEKIAPVGKVTKIDLPDGSEVWLNAGSKISYPVSFRSEKREITLEGEAFFKVKHDTKRPFLIYTQGMVTQVLGTSFNVSAYSHEKQIKVTVLSGKVAVYKQTEAGKAGKTERSKAQFVEANQELVYIKAMRKFSAVNKSVKSTDAIAWKEGNLVFKSAQLTEVLQRLERYYGIKINTDVQVDCAVTVNFNKEPLEKAMRILSQLVNGELNYENGSYKLTGVICR